MARFIKKRSTKHQTAPGSLTFVGDKKVSEPTIDLIRFGPGFYERIDNVPTTDVSKYMESGKVCWFNVTGIHDPELIRLLGESFNVHILDQEDILNTTQRAKFEEFEHYIFLVLRMLISIDEGKSMDSEQLSILIEENLLISFQEKEGDVFKNVRERLENPNSRIRTHNADYLAFALMDAVIDQYIYIIEHFGERIELIDDELMGSMEPELLEKINSYKKEINFLRKSIRPVRELILNYKKSESVLIRKHTLPFLKDLEDHIIHATEAIEIYREMLSDQMNTYNSGLSNKLNDVMRVLTVFSVVFIPLTFIAGIYGTNFEYLPELKYRFAYPVFWGVLVLLAGVMLLYFKRKKWL